MMVKSARPALGLRASWFALALLFPAGSLAYRPVIIEAEVYGETSKQYPEGAAQAVEVCRFVTPFRTGLEALVDLTPYSPLFKAFMETGQDISFFAFIDTWVNNATRHHEFFVDRSNDRCTSQLSAEATGGKWGNGWGVNATLVFWPHLPTANETRQELEAAAAGMVEATGVADRGTSSTQPFASITLASGIYGDYHFGDTEVQEGVAVDNGAQISLDSPDGLHPSSVEEAVIVPCPGGKSDVENGVEMKEIHDTIQSYALDGNIEDAEGATNSFFKKQAQRSMSVLKVIKSDVSQRVVLASYNVLRARPRIGMEVFLASQFVRTERFVNSSNSWAKVAYPFEPVGRITRVFAGKIEVKMQLPCIPSEDTDWNPGLRIPNDGTVLSRARAVRATFQKLIQDASRGRLRKASMLQGTDSRSSAVSWVPPMVVHDGENFAPAAPKARLKLQSLAKGALQKSRRVGLDVLSRARGVASRMRPQLFQRASLLETETHGRVATEAMQGKASTGLQTGEKVCVLVKRRQGSVFNHVFTRPSLASGGRALLQVAFTGHGWQNSLYKCGEFCEVSYRLMFDGVEATNVSVFRNDCEENPLPDQYGTWQFARNGWCPGSVEPGLFIDVTDTLQKVSPDAIDGEEVTHHVSFHLSVRPPGSSQYMPYTNTRMFPGVKADSAKIYTGMTLFLYSPEAVASIKAQAGAYTAAEKAIRLGISNPDAVVSEMTGQASTGARGSTSFMEVDGEDSGPVDMVFDHPLPRPAHASSFMDRAEQLDGQTPGAGTAAVPFDTEGRFPWYTYRSDTDGPPGGAVGATRLSVVTEQLVQGRTRLVIQTTPSSAFPKSWSRVSLHFRLYQPPGLSLDWWDRVGSVGVFVPGHRVGRV